MEDSNETLVPENGATNDCEMAPPDANDSQAKVEERTERLMIHKMVNENFKSYAGAQELGPFHKVRCKCDNICKHGLKGTLYVVISHIKRHMIFKRGKFICIL